MILQRDETYTVVCNIRTPVGQEEKIGTGIFVAKGNDAFLVTAAHVARDTTVHTDVVFADANGAPIRIKLNVLTAGSKFTPHPQADMAKVKLDQSLSNMAYLSGRCFPYDHIDFGAAPVSKDAELTTVGFPHGLGATGAKSMPLTFRTYAASPNVSLARADEATKICDFIVLEAPSVGGYSGGPVFDLGYQVSGNMISTKEKTLLHGLIHGTISDETGGKLAAVTPCKYLNGWL